MRSRRGASPESLQKSRPGGPDRVWKFECACGGVSHLVRYRSAKTWWELTGEVENHEGPEIADEPIHPPNQIIREPHFNGQELGLASRSFGLSISFTVGLGLHTIPSHGDPMTRSSGLCACAWLDWAEWELWALIDEFRLSRSYQKCLFLLLCNKMNKTTPFVVGNAKFLNSPIFKEK
jgi:hypothetical protein